MAKKKSLKRSLITCDRCGDQMTRQEATCRTINRVGGFNGRLRGHTIGIVEVRVCPACNDHIQFFRSKLVKAIFASLAVGGVVIILFYL
jgi:hypothetical protein